MHDMAEESRTLRLVPDEPQPDAARIAARQVRDLLFGIAADSNDWTLADIRTAGLEVLARHAVIAADEWDPYAYLGSAAMGVLTALTEMGAMPK